MTYKHQYTDGTTIHYPLGKVVCIGRNYAEHAKELNNPVPTEPLLFIKAGSCTVPLDSGFSIPADRGAGWVMMRWMDSRLCMRFRMTWMMCGSVLGCRMFRPIWTGFWRRMWIRIIWWLRRCARRTKGVMLRCCMWGDWTVGRICAC